MASLVSMTSRTMMAKLHKNTEVEVTEKAFSSINTLHLLRKSEFHCNLVLTRNASTTLEKTKLDFQAQYGHATARMSRNASTTLKKQMLDFQAQFATTRILEEVQLEEGGGEGNGSNNRNGGGKGNGNGGDDNNYFRHFNDGNDADDGAQKERFLRRDPIPENFDPSLVQDILQEWDTTIQSLPAEIRQAVEMKTISSAQMVRFLSTYAQPTRTRALSCMSPESVSRALMGRILADPAFLQKLLFDEMVTIACALRSELKHRRDMKKEWDIVAVNVLTAVASTACMNWALAPSRSYVSIFKYKFQNALQKLPNHVFDNSFPLREFDMAKRVLSFVYKNGELGLFGLVIGALASVMPLTRGENMSIPLFSMSRRAWNYGVLLGLSGNLRYQVVFGLERLMQDHFEHLGAILFFSALLRAFNVSIGNASRVALGRQGELPIAINDNDLHPYRRKTRRVSSSKNLTTSLFDDVKDHNKDGKQERTSNMVDKKKVRRKVTTRSR